VYCKHFTYKYLRLIITVGFS